MVAATKQSRSASAEISAAFKDSLIGMGMLITGMGILSLVWEQGTLKSDSDFVVCFCFHRAMLELFLLI